MSIDKLPFALVPIEAFYDRRLTLTQLRVLGALFSFRNRSSGLAYPTRESIAARTGLPVNKISTATSQLVALGWLRKTGTGGRSTPCIYEVTTPPDLTQAVLSAIAAIEDGALPAKPETVPDSGRVKRPKTVTDSVTVPESETVTDSGTKTLPESVTKPSPNRGGAENRPRTDQGTEGGGRAREASDDGTRLEISALPPEWADWTREQRPDLDPQQVWTKFHDYWIAQAGPRSRKADWFAAWRFWTNTEHPPRRNGNGASESAHERRQRIHEQIRHNAQRHFPERGAPEVD